MQTLDKSVEQDARELLLGVVQYFDANDQWPHSGAISQLASYKRASDKAAAMAYLVERGWVEQKDGESRGSRPRRLHIATEAGRAVLLPPDPLPEIVPEMPIPFPEDDVECQIYSHNLFFYRRHGRWPTGSERVDAFGPTRRKAWSPARRKRAIQNMIERGDLVRVTFRYREGDTTLLIVPRICPEYVDKNGWVFYNAPSSQDGPDLSLGTEEGMVGVQPWPTSGPVPG